MPARRLVGKNKLTDIDYLRRCRKFFINELTVRFRFFFVEIVFLKNITSLPVQEIDIVHDRMKERKIGTILRTPMKLCFFLSIDLFLRCYFRLMFSFPYNCDILYQFSSVWRLSKCVFFIRRTLWDLNN